MTDYPQIHTVLRSFEETPCDRETIPQDRINLSTKVRSSLFPWRGQFSPELVEIFLSTFAKSRDVVLDPFVGSGTVLFESARKGLTCYATEINPAAVEMASTAHFVNVEPENRVSYINTAKSLAEAYLTTKTSDLFSNENYHGKSSEEASIENVIGKLAQELADDPLTRNVLVNALIRYMGYRKSHTVLDFLRAINEHATIVTELPYSDRPIKVFHEDARTIPLDDSSIDLVVTSPPYINVFNYHQNNRPAMEAIGWDLLRIAQSEFGSNRKNRQNRFLTVVQYCLDMLDTLHELRRLLAPHGRVIIVVGRESRIRGVSFKNGRLVAALACGGAGFRLERLQERVYKNKFGEMIYEDILHLVPAADVSIQGDSFARALAQVILTESAEVTESEVRSQILDAVDRAYVVQKSPIFRLPSFASTFASTKEVGALTIG